MQNIFNRLVRASTTGAFQARRLKPSDPVSTRFNNEVSPRIVDIFGRVKIAVMVLAALWTIPLSNIERETGQNVAAATASLRGWEEAVHKPQLPAVSLALVGEHLAELSEAGIGDRFREAVVSHHPAHVQIFNADSVVSAHQIGGHLVEVIFSGVADVFLYSSNADTLPIPHTATLDATRENPLSLGESSLVFARVLRVGDALIIAGSGQAVDSQVNANRFPGRFELGKLFVENQRDEVTPAGSFGNCNGSGFRLELTTPVHVEATKPGDNQVRVVGVGAGKLKGGSCVFSGLLAPFLLEGGILGLLVEKLHEGVVQVPQGLLNRDARHFSEPRRFLFALPLGKLGGCLVVANPFLPLLPSIRPIPQRPVVGIPTTAEDLGKLGLLGLGWCKTEFVSNLHTNNLYA